MTPAQIRILLHHYVTPLAYDGCESDDFVMGEIKQFEALGMLERRDKWEPSHSRFAITEKGKFYMEALCNVPLPVQKWVIPEKVAEADGQEGNWMP